MNLDSLTIGEVRQIAGLFGTNTKPCPFIVGQAYLIRTVTMAWLGRVVEIVGDFLVLEEAAWIADLGRFHLANSPDRFAEVEPAPSKRVYVGINTIVDAQDWYAGMATEAK